MGRYTYHETSDLLSQAATARCETRWQFDALHEQGGMSHPPRGFIYTLFGPASPNGAGCFDSIMVDITN